jgi:SAM-dependent methyltransferase
MVVCDAPLATPTGRHMLVGEPDPIEEMNRYYQARAPWHDEYMGYVSNTHTEALLTPIVRDIEGDVAGRDLLEVACGTGNWTQVLAHRAHRVLATDVSEAMLEIARAKEYSGGQVTFAVADAYALDGVAEGEFSAAFAADWWSHVPHSRLGSFLSVLHGKLRGGSRVVFLDMLESHAPEFGHYRVDSEGNRIYRRRLPDGREFDVIKNFPTERQLRATVASVATDIEVRKYPELARWTLSYGVVG